MSRVLLTAFEPFGGQPRNASLEVARALASAPPDGVSIDVLVLPVVADVCADIAWRHIEATHPDLVLALGQAGGSTHVRLEDRALNLDDFTLPDNAGQIRHRKPIFAGGLFIEPATVAVEQVLIAVRRAGFAVLHSLSAGSFVCNHLYYHLLHRARGSGLAHRTVFVHLPLLPEQVPVGRPMASVPLVQQVDCLRAILMACL